MPEFKPLAILLASSLLMGTPVLARDASWKVLSNPDIQQVSNIRKSEDSATKTQTAPADSSAKTLAVISRALLISPEGCILSRVEPGETVTVQLIIKDSAIKTEDLFGQDKPTRKKILRAIDITHKTDDSFEGTDEPIITVHSAPNERLEYTVRFENVRCTGNGNLFSIRVAYPDLRLSSPDLSTEFRQCVPNASDSKNPDDSSSSSPDTNPDGEVQPETGEDANDQPAPEAGDSQENGSRTSSAPTPYIIVDQYTYGNTVEAGKTFTLAFTARNTSRTIPVENIMVSLETDEGLAITSSSNSFYIDSIPDGGAITKEIKMKAISIEKSSSPAVTLSFRYEYVVDGERQSKDTTEKISIPVIEPDRFTITPPEIPENLPAGNEVELAFAYVNKGKATLANVEAILDADGLETPAKTQNIGNIESGKSGTIVFVVTPSEMKTYKPKVTISYEDPSGETVKKTFDLTLTAGEPAPVTDPNVSGNNPYGEMEEQTGSSMGWIGLLAGGIIALLIGLVGWKFWKKKQKAKEQAELDDFLDDDLFGEEPDKTDPSDSMADRNKE